MALERLREEARNPRALLESISLMLIGRAQRAFVDQKRGDQSWRPRSVPNRIGVLMDLKEGRTPPSRRWDPTPAGVDTGRLRNSIAGTISGNVVTVGSSLDYASKVQRGDTTTVQLDRDLRSRLAAWLRSLSGDEKKRARASFGFLFHTGSLTVTTPARPFLLITPQDRRDIRDLAKAWFLGHFKKGK